MINFAVLGISSNYHIFQVYYIKFMYHCHYCHNLV